MLGLTGIFRDMATGHTLYPFTRLFTAKPDLVFGIAVRATRSGNELFANHTRTHSPE